VILLLSYFPQSAEAPLKQQLPNAAGAGEDAIPARQGLELGRAGSASHRAHGRQAEKHQGCRLLQWGGRWSLSSALKEQ